MSDYSVKFLAFTDMTGYVDVEADTPEAAVKIAQEKIADPQTAVDWEFVDMREPLDHTIKPIEVWDGDQEDVLLELPFDQPVGNLVGFQLADASGQNIQGCDNDPTNLASFETMSPTVAVETIAKLPKGFLLMPIYEGDIERPEIGSPDIDKRRRLESHGYVVGQRDQRLNTNHRGRDGMPIKTAGNYLVVGADGERIAGFAVKSDAETFNRARDSIMLDREHVELLADSIQAVIDNWGRGDLAGAVNALHGELEPLRESLRT